jgi:hypothetical protein
MALKGKPVAISNTSTNIYTCPSGVEAAVHGLLFSNNTGSPLAVDVIVYNQADGAETTVATDLAVAANSYITWTKPVNLNAGDVIKAVSSASSGLVCLYSVYEGSSAPVATGFTGRGVWSSGSTYAVNDIVTTNAGTYLALQAGTNKDPATQTAYWMFLQGVSASALPSQSGQTGKFLTTDGTDASWAAISSESIRKALPLKSGASLTAGRAVNINSSGEVGDYPVVNTLGTLVTSTTTQYTNEIGFVSTDGSRVLTAVNVQATSSANPFQVRGTAITGTTTTSGGLTNLSPSGSYNWTFRCYPINETQFFIFYCTSASTAPYDNAATFYRYARVAEVDSSGNVTLGTAYTYSNSDIYLPYGSGFDLYRLPSGRFATYDFCYNSGVSSIFSSKTYSVSGTTVTATADADFNWGTLYQPYITTNNKLIGVTGNALYYCNYDGSTTSSYASMEIVSDKRSTADAIGALLSASYGILLYQKSNNDIVLQTFSINQTTGQRTNTSQKYIANSTFNLNTPRICIINSTDTSISYKLGATTYFVSFKLNSTGDVIGSGIPLILNTLDNAIYTINKTSTSNVVRMFYNTTVGNSQNITINTYDTLSWSGIGATSTSQTTSPAEIVTGGVCGGFSGLTPSVTYYVNELTFDGQVTSTIGNYPVGTAVSSTEILLG